MKAHRCGRISEGSFRATLASMGLAAVGLLTVSVPVILLGQSAAFFPPPIDYGPPGTFWLVSQTNYPPMPYNPFPELPLFQLEDGSFLVDDSQVDYDALRAAYQIEISLQQLEWEYGMETMDGGDGPPPPGGGGGGGGTNVVLGLGQPTFLITTQLALLPPFFTNLTSTLLTATNTEPGAMYDLFTVTNLNLTNWMWLVRGDPGQTNWYLSTVPDFESYYQLGTMLDTDGDGLTDAYEGLTSKTNPLLADTDGDGLSDWYELAVSITDPLTPEPVPTLNSRPVTVCAVP